ncbi:PREDICTED: uncharacterized protein DDB_G0287625-like [Papilio polytes]|uniref:uncharacterized protein DDB_G0287625-like n=1 Tax=Papilio polytes TaxID=76194 RepID=UPI000675C322|nr:PREDICTED: uncharacterized protein DDB_G0287625-like [Papilio polytes]
MPIVQNVEWDGDVPLTQKIRECVQIEVHQEDKMPPLICELCVDKVNDFYEFSEMCKQTNMKTRLRLGLPPQTMPRGAPNAGDCILGVTETIFANDDSNEPIIKHVGKQSKSKKETSDKVKMKSSENSRNSKSRLSPDTNRRATRRSISSPTNILTSRNRNSKDQKNVQEEDILVTPKSKRGRERDSISDLPVKRVKIEDTATSSKSKRKSRSPPRYRTRSPPKSRTRSPETNVCKVCKRSFPNKGRLENHVKTHQNEIKNSKTKKSPPVAETNYKDRTEKIQVRGKNDSKQKDRNMCDCGKEYSTPRNLHRHRINCKYKKDVIIDPKLLAKIRPLQIRISRCDPILDKKYSISEIPHVFGLDKNCTYPYFNIKSEPKTGKDAMVRIESPIKHVFDEADYIHWDSDTSTDSNNEPIQKKNRISTLSILSLKTIFSSRYLGRVRRRKRKVKTEIMEKLTEKDNFEVIDSFDDVHDLERINDSSFDQLFGNDYQNISVPNPEDIKDIGNKNKDESLEEGNNTEDINKEEYSNIDVSKKDNDKEISKEENTNKDDGIEENIDKEVSKENSNADVSKEENSNKDVGNEENSNTEVSNEKDSNIDDSKEENINKEVTKEDTSDKEIIISNEDTKKHKLSKEVINSENSLQKEGNGNDKEDSNLNEETDKTVNNQENSNNDENDSVKENVNQKEDSLNEDVNSINKDSRFSKEDINSNECENIQELNKKNIDERNIEHKKETNGLSEDVKVNGESNDDVVMDDQKLMDELNAQIGEDVMEKHLSLDDFSEDEDF